MIAFHGSCHGKAGTVPTVNVSTASRCDSGILMGSYWLHHHAFAIYSGDKPAERERVSCHKFVRSSSNISQRRRAWNKEYNISGQVAIKRENERTLGKSTGNFGLVVAFSRMEIL